MKPATPLLWAVPALAVMMLILTITPAESWKAPINDAAYHGFDTNLVYANPGTTGSVVVSPTLIDLQAHRGSVPTVLLATTLLPKLAASLKVSVLSNAAAEEPLRFGVWSPWTSTGYFITFRSAITSEIVAETLADGTLSSTLIGGRVVHSTVLGHYKIGSSYVVTFALDKSAGTLASSVTAADGTKLSDSVNSQQFPAIFGTVQTSLAASAGEGESHVTLQNFELTLPHQRLWASKVDDRLEMLILVALSIAGLFAVGIKIIAASLARYRRGRPQRNRTANVTAYRGLLLTIAGIAAVSYFVGNFALFPLGGHPFDFGAEKLYAYVARTYGLEQLYYLPNLISTAKNWHGVPYLETAFPYELLIAYLFAGIGWITSTLFASGHVFALDAGQLTYVIKSVNVVFGLADGALIYLILRQIEATRRWSVLAGLLWLFNPAVWFSMSIWGQTHVVSLFFVLAAVLFAEKRLPFWAWLALAAACFTRPQMLVFGLLLAIVFLRKFTWHDNVFSLSWAVIVSFVAWLPLTLRISPSLPIDIMLNNFRVQEVGGNAAALTTVSQSAYSLWPLVTYFAQGASGLQRAFVSSSTPLVGSITYQQAGLIATLVATVIIGAALAVRKRANLESGGYIPLVALGIASFLMLLTGLVATHFLLALPFLLLCRRWTGTLPFLCIVAIWTVTTLAPMYGEMSFVLSRQQFPVLAGQSGAVRLFFMQLTSSDQFITAAVVANLCAAIWLAFLIFRPAQPSNRATVVA